MQDLFMNYSNWINPKKEDILNKIYSLRQMYKEGMLGGNFMPEDSNPNIEKGAKENYHYFTLPMALNYQRNSYTLWASAKKTYENPDLKKIFFPEHVICSNDFNLKEKLTLYKVALQPEKQTKIWRTISHTIYNRYNGDLRNLFKECHYSVRHIKETVQIKYKKDFPYLSGNKICNYWLYVMENYTDAKLIDREFLNIAPDTHVTQATFMLGLLSPKERDNPNLQTLVIKVWEDILKGTDILPIDIHTPLWLWSRSDFIPIITKN